MKRGRLGCWLIVSPCNQMHGERGEFRKITPPVFASKRAEVVAFANFYAIGAQDVVARHDVKEEVRVGVCHQILVTFERLRLAADRKLDIFRFRSVDVGWP